MMNDNSVFIIIFVVCIIVLPLAFINGWHYQTGAGEHTGYITAVEEGGIFFKTDTAYVKTDTQSSQEDAYCVVDPQVYAELQHASEAKAHVTVFYNSWLVNGFKYCNHESAVITGVKATVSGSDATSVAVAPATDRIANLVAEATQESLMLAPTDASLNELVANGRYDYRDPDITDAHFPAAASGKDTADAVLLGFNEDVTSDEVESVANQLGLTLGTAKDCANLGAQYPDRQRTNLLVCLGDDWHVPYGFHRVVRLLSAAGRRWLNLDFREGKWGSLYRFLAFRKSR